MPDRHLSKLPPDPEGMNEDRRTRAMAALIAFDELTDRDLQTEGGFRVVMADLLCDLAHLCDGVVGERCFGGLLATAQMHYEAETAGKGRQTFCGRL